MKLEVQVAPRVHRQTRNRTGHLALLVMSDRRPLHSHTDGCPGRARIRPHFLEPGRVMLQAPDLTIIFEESERRRAGTKFEDRLNERRAMHAVSHRYSA